MCVRLITTKNLITVYKTNTRFHVAVSLLSNKHVDHRTRQNVVKT